MIRATLEEFVPQLLHDSLQALHEPFGGLFVLRFSRSRARLLIGPRRARIHLTDRRFSNPSSPSPFVMKLRKHLAGAALIAADQVALDRIVELTFHRRHAVGGSTLHLIAELMGNRGNLILLSEGSILATFQPTPRLPVGGAYVPPAEQPKQALSEIGASDLERILAEPAPHRALAAQVDGLGFETARALIAAAGTGSDREIAASLATQVRQLAAASAAPQPAFCPEHRMAFFFPLTPMCVPKRSLSQALDEELDAALDLEMQSAARLHSRRSSDWEFAKRARIRQRLLRVINASPTADELRHQADLLLAYGQDLPRGSSEFALNDPTTGLRIQIPLREDLDAVENAQRIYRKARRLKRGMAAAREKLGKIERDIESIRAAAASPPPAGDNPSLTRSDESTSARPDPPTLRRRRSVMDGYTIDVGRSARENDELLRRASPDDVWLHARGVPGSHVFVRRRGKEEIPGHVLQHAARLAARHSKNRDESKVEVSYTQVKHVRKPRNASPGLVILARESTLVVTPAPRETNL
ncbi:NFACT family protein, partial [Candidatus Bipolaricaulota bacterium]|nr:NFACT family protein [Candidatus Bipolaricaulota bacterium]